MEFKTRNRYPHTPPETEVQVSMIIPTTIVTCKPIESFGNSFPAKTYIRLDCCFFAKDICTLYHHNCLAENCVKACRSIARKIASKTGRCQKHCIQRNGRVGILNTKDLSCGR